MKLEQFPCGNHVGRLIWHSEPPVSRMEFVGKCGMPLSEATTQIGWKIVGVFSYAAIRNRPSRMICSSPSSDSNQMLKPSPTTSMCVDEYHGAPVCSP